MHTLDSQELKIDKQKPAALNVLADYLDEHCTKELSLDDLCTLSGYSASPEALGRTFA